MPDEDGVTVETSRTYPCCVLKLSTLATIDIVPLTALRRPGGNSRDLFSDYDDLIDNINISYSQCNKPPNSVGPDRGFQLISELDI